MKRRSTLEDDSSAAVKKRRVVYGTFQKWRKHLDCECLTVSWLDCTNEKVNSKTVVSKLKCNVCSKFEHNIKGRKNFSDKWILGADSVRISNVRDHAKNYQHRSRRRK